MDLGTWISKIDIHGHNLNVVAGQPLPKAWQNAAKMAYLKNTYDENSFEFQTNKTAGEIHVGGSMQLQMDELKAEIVEIKSMLAQALSQSKKEVSEGVVTKKK